MRSKSHTRLLPALALASVTLALVAFYFAVKPPNARDDYGKPLTAPPAAAGDLVTTPPGLEGIPADSVSPVVTRPEDTGSERPVLFTVVDDGIPQGLSSTAPTVGEALVRAGITVYLADRVSPALDARLTSGLTVTIDRSRPISVAVDGATLRTRVSPGIRTVGQALAEAGVALAGLDYSLPASGDPLPEDGVILVKRVVEKVIPQSESLPFSTTYQARPDLEIDSTIVVQEGRDGVLESRVRVRYEEGVEAGRTTEQQESQPPADQIIGYGTNIVVRTLDSPDGPIQYWRKIFVRITAYSPSRSGTPSTAPWYGRTRTGKLLTKGMVAVDPTVISLGTRLYVLGYGFGSAEDTGGKIKGKWLDLGYDDFNFVHWYGYTDVYLLAPPPPADQIVWMLP